MCLRNFFSTLLEQLELCSVSLCRGCSYCCFTSFDDNRSRCWLGIGCSKEYVFQLVLKVYLSVAAFHGIYYGVLGSLESLKFLNGSGGDIWGRYLLSGFLCFTAEPRRFFYYKTVRLLMSEEVKFFVVACQLAWCIIIVCTNLVLVDNGTIGLCRTNLSL